MPFNLGVTELLVIFGVIFLFFGAKRLPELGGAMGKGILEFKRNIQEMKEGIQAAAGEEEIAGTQGPDADEPEPRKLSE